MTAKAVAEAFGLSNVDAAIEAATEAGLPLAAAFALMEMESNGRNIWGGDVGGYFSGKKGEVTEADYRTFRKAIDGGAKSNGVGPLQITWKGFFPDAEKQGLQLWVPRDNFLYGFRLCESYHKKFGDWLTVGTRYNGKAAYGKTFARRVGEWAKRLEATGGAPVVVAKSGKGWKLAPSLIALFAEVDAKWPKRNTSSDGSIGDASHAARASEHNPDHDGDPMPTGYVSAVDITKDSAAQVEAIRKKLIADPRTWYVIHNGSIWSRTHGFAKQKYTGSNPHLHHIHISLMQTVAAADGVGSWGIGSSSPPEPPKPPVETGLAVDLRDVAAAFAADPQRPQGKGLHPEDVRPVELALLAEGLLDAGHAADGYAGTRTAEAYKAWQKRCGFTGRDADGIPGLDSLSKLGAAHGFRVR